MDAGTRPAAATQPLAEVRPYQAGGTRRGLALFARRKPLGAAGGVVIALMLLTGALAPLLAPADPLTTSGAQGALQPPSAANPLGTDHFGRDVLSRTIYGARTSLMVATAGVLLGMALALAVGTVGAYLGGWVDLLLQFVMDAMLAFPLLMLLITIMAVLGEGATNLAIGLGIVMTPRVSRVIRSVVLALKQNDYILAGRALGCSSLRIMTAHIFPNTVSSLLVLVSIYLGWAILLEAAASFLGMGIPQPMPEWGRDLSDAGRGYLVQAPWLSIFPGVAISLAVFGFNMLGDALRDVLDPRLRGTEARW